MKNQILKFSNKISWLTKTAISFKISTKFFSNFSFWYKCTFIRQCDLVLIQSDVEFIKSSKYITDWILGLIFEVGVSSSSPKDLYTLVRSLYTVHVYTRCKHSGPGKIRPGDTSPGF